VKAIEDALREFPADEVLVITHPDDDASWLEAGSGKTAQTPVHPPDSPRDRRRRRLAHVALGLTR